MRKKKKKEKKKNTIKRVRGEINGSTRFREKGDYYRVWQKQPEGIYAHTYVHAIACGYKRKWGKVKI